MKPNTVAASGESFDSQPSEASVHSIAALLALFLIRAYQLVISPCFAGSCRFLPSCSAYAAEAVARHGAVKGSWLALKRLGRCHPFCEAGHDPVPMPLGTRPSGGGR